MKLPPLEYTVPKTLEDALDLLAEHGDEAKIIAGGQSLVPMLAMRLARPALLVDINEVPGLAGIEDRGGTLAFGATTRERDAERSPLVASRVPALAEALPLIGHVSIRNRGTVGGSIAHADAHGELPAVAMVTDAEVVVRSRRGERVIAAEDFFLGHFTTALADDECLVEVRIPTTPTRTGWAFGEITRRHGDFALVGVAAMVSLDGARAIEAARICLFGVDSRPVRPRALETGLTGQSPTAQTFAAVAAAAAADLDPPGDVHGSGAYRKKLAETSVRRALALATSRAQEAA